MHTGASACTFGVNDDVEDSYNCKARSLVGRADIGDDDDVGSPGFASQEGKEKSHMDPFSRLEENWVHIREVLRFPYRKLSRCYENESKPCTVNRERSNWTSSRGMLHRSNKIVDPPTNSRSRRERISLVSEIVQERSVVSKQLKKRQWVHWYRQRSATMAIYFICCAWETTMATLYMWMSLAQRNFYQ